MGLIYKFTIFSPTRGIYKSYIGQTKRTFAIRRYEHFSDARQYKNGLKTNGCIAFWNAINKYGIMNFTTEILIECDDEEIDNYEEEFIIEYDSLTPNGYNLTSGGSTNKTIPKCIREKISRNTRIGMGSSEESLELPMYMQINPDSGSAGYVIDGHPMLQTKYKRNTKYFTIANYGSKELAKDACYDFLLALDNDDFKPEIVVKKGNNLEKGIIICKSGFQVKRIINKWYYSRIFRSTVNSNDENLENARKYLHEVLNDPRHHNFPVINNTEIIPELIEKATGTPGFMASFYVNGKPCNKSFSANKTREENYKDAVDWVNKEKLSIIKK